MHNFTLSYVRLAYMKHENFMHMIRWVTQWFEECPPHSSSSLLEEGPSSLKDQSHCQNLMRSLKENPGW